jgi:hypothetical protein
MSMYRVSAVLVTALALLAAACGSGSKPAAVSSKHAVPLNGVYVVDTTRSELAAHPDGVTPLIPENWGHFVYVLDGTRLAFTQEDAQACTWQYAKLVVHPKVLTLDFIDGGATKSPNQAFNKPGDFFKFRWSLYRDTLTLSAVPGGLGTVSSSEFMVKPWHRVSTTPSRTVLSKDCPPPKAALP